MNAFLTGSHAYGKITNVSDIDVVVLMGKDHLAELVLMADEVGSDVLQSGCRSLRFGKLDLLVCTSRTAFDVWFRGTETLVGQRPVTREEAKKVFMRLREVAGLKSPANQPDSTEG